LRQNDFPSPDVLNRSAVPTPKLFLTPKGLAVVGPRAIGHDFGDLTLRRSVTPSRHRLDI
jgi:hypothetical protein